MRNCSSSRRGRGRGRGRGRSRSSNKGLHYVRGSTAWK